MNTLTLYWLGHEDEARHILAEGRFPLKVPWSKDRPKFLLGGKPVLLAVERYLGLLNADYVKTADWNLAPLAVLRVEIGLTEEAADRFACNKGRTMPTGYYMFLPDVLNGLLKSMVEVPGDWILDPVRQEHWAQQRRDDDDLCDILALHCEEGEGEEWIRGPRDL